MENYSKARMVACYLNIYYEATDKEQCKSVSKLATPLQKKTSQMLLQRINPVTQKVLESMDGQKKVSTNEN